MSESDSQKTSQLYRFGAFRLDAAERRVWREDELIRLAPKQFDLLFYFVENAGRVTTKSELLEAVWADTFIEETTLARNVSWLRKLLEEGGGESFIETVPKFGYRFTAEVTRFADENLFVVEEETVQYTRSEEIITFDEAKLARTAVTKSAPTKSAKSFAAYALPIVLIVFILIAGSGFLLYRNQKTQQTGAATLNQATTLNVKATIAVKNITVDATREAVEVGFKIQPGDVIRVSAMGIHQPEAGQTWTLQGEEKGEISAEHVFQNAAPWSLVGWIGTEIDKTDYFQASTNPAFQAEKSGALYLAVNDLADRYADNRGGLNVAVVLYRQFNISAEGNDVKMAWGNELVNIHRDDTLEIRSRGNVSYWQNGELYDLDGSNHSTEGHLAPELNARSLIAKIGDHPPFKAGKNFAPQKINVSGWLFLSVNDRIFNWVNGSFKNNSGEITTDVEINRQKEEFKNPI